MGARPARRARAAVAAPAEALLGLGRSRWHAPGGQPTRARRQVEHHPVDEAVRVLVVHDERQRAGGGRDAREGQGRRDAAPVAGVAGGMRPPAAKAGLASRSVRGAGGSGAAPLPPPPPQPASTSAVQIAAVRLIDASIARRALASSCESWFTSSRCPTARPSAPRPARPPPASGSWPPRSTRWPRAATRSASVQAVAGRAGVAVGHRLPPLPLEGRPVRRGLPARVAARARRRDRGGRRPTAAAAERVAAAVEAFCRRALAGPVLAYALIAEPVDPAVEAERLRLRRGYRDAFAARARRRRARGRAAPARLADASAAALVGAPRRGARRPAVAAQRPPAATRRWWPASSSSA